ncbi:DUF4145 domain-containing protein [Massilia sp. 9I]|uniref:DUF4145 domain-containing protein n=1 Tax=Massilia sp. 9I TaxID=2653152 RepID=UPI0012EF985C|nr:DUF4145 domain-containing protein [Massilia sp. 9I]VXC04640.1 conserved hypothetical protein [Massilia sp. 9I]
MKCPHCHIEIHEDFDEKNIARFNSIFIAKGAVGPASWRYFTMTCPACSKGIIKFAERNASTDAIGPETYIVPRHPNKPSAPPEVPAHLAEDFNEAAAVMGDSPKASAALSRRCLQGLLREQGFNNKDLAPAIDAILDARVLPPALAENLDAIRNIGNFAAHPMKNTNTGEIIAVEPHEADWNLEVLEGLFNFFYVAPAIAKRKRDALNAKLGGVNKPPMK